MGYRQGSALSGKYFFDTGQASYCLRKKAFGKKVMKEDGISDTDHIIDLMLKGFGR